MDKIALQLLLILQLIVPDTFLTIFTGFPADFRTFVAADMNISAGEQGYHFSQYIFQKMKRMLFPCTENVRKNTHFSSTLKGPGLSPQASSGYAAKAATAWPGISISGITVIYLSAAY